MEPAEFKHLTYEIQDGVGVVTLTRPESRNAISAEMRQDFFALADRLRDDESRVVIFTGAGEAFCAGGDVAHFEREWTGAEFRAESQRLSQFFNDLETLEKPVIAAINGAATGAGLQLSMACDLRIASETARVGSREHFLGLIPGHGGTARLVKLIGLSRAKWLYFTGDLVSAREAMEIGLVHRVVAPEELMPAAMELAQRLAQRAPQSLGLAKRLLNAAANADLDSALFMESLAQSGLIQTNDHKEGIRAFRDKDKPDFTGS